MSHSTASPERGWDSGLNPDDYVALVKCTKVGDGPTDWQGEEPIQYIPVAAMKSAYKEHHVISEKPKGATEGYETRIIWPSAIVDSTGKVTSIDGKIQYRRSSDNRTITLSLEKRGIKLTPLAKVGDQISPNQIIASVVPVAMSFQCSKQSGAEYYTRMLKSPSLSDRYGAAKALHSFPSGSTVAILLEKMKDTKEHIYVRLEAASSLLKIGRKESLSFFEEMLEDEYLENRLESVIILGEIKNNDACSLLVRTLVDPKQDPEIRAGAAWSLGELRNQKALNALVRVFNEVQATIRAEAARALAKLGDDNSSGIIALLPTSNEEERAGLAWALSKSGKFKIADLLPAMSDDEARKWVAWIIGTQNEARYIDHIEQLRKKDNQVYFAVTVLWKILSSWIEGLDVY